MPTPERRHGAPARLPPAVSDPTYAVGLRPEPQAQDLTTRPDPAATEARNLATRAPTGYLPGLDGLRAVAVLAVVGFHLHDLAGGFLGVDVFFVVSGFLITRLLLAELERTGTVALGAFWVRRFRRLVPALLAVLVVVAIGSKLWLPGWRLIDIRSDGLGALAYVANWRFVFSNQSYFTQSSALSPLRHTWSLAIEEQFYVLWPLLVVGAAAIGRRHARRSVAVLAGVGALASAAWMAVASSGPDLSRVYYGTDTRVFALLAGAWLSTWWDPAVHRAPDRRARRIRSRWLALGALVALVPLGILFAKGAEDSPAFYRFGFQLSAMISVLVVAGVATGVGVVGRVFSNRVLIWIGRRSYSIYLWSWPTQVFASERFRIEGASLDLVVVAGSLALASLSFWLVEEPVRLRRRPAGLARRRRSQRVARPPRRVPSFALSGVAVIAVLAVIVGSSAGAPKPPAYERVSDKEAVASALAPAIGAPRAVTTIPTTAPPGVITTVPVPAPGPLDAKAPVLVDPNASVPPASIRGRPLRVMIAGDSVGWSLGWRLRPSDTPGISLQDRAIIACGLMPPESSFIVAKLPPEQYGKQCQKAGLAESRGLAAAPDAVLLVVGAWEVYDHLFQGTRYEVGRPDYRHLLELRLQQRIDTYRAAGAATIIPAVPCFAPNAARLGTERHQQRRLDWVNVLIRNVAVRNPGWVRIVDPTAQLCNGPDDAKSTTPDGDPLREDGAHYDHDAATWLWQSWLSGQLGAAFVGGPKA